MAEHARSNGFQWCDTTQYMIFDQHIGMERVAGKGYLISLEDALEHVQHCKGWENRKRIIKVECITGFPLSDSALLRHDNQ